MGLTEEMIDEAIENYPASGKFTEAEKVALRYSELMATDPGAIGEEFYGALREHYSEAEIVELGVFIGFNAGYHTFFGTLDFYPMFSPDGRLVSQEESRRIYGDRPVSHLRGPLARAQAEAAKGGAKAPAAARR